MTGRHHEISKFMLNTYPEINVRAIDFIWQSPIVLHPDMILPLLRRGYNPFIVTMFDNFDQNTFDVSKSESLNSKLII